MADIEPLPGIEWNAHASLHDALNRCAIDRPVVILWIEEDGRVAHSSSALKKDVLWMLETKRQRVIND